MTRVLLVTQEKGGVGKTVLARSLAEAVPDAPVIEIDASRRLLELKDRVSYFPMRADREAIDLTGGKAARAEYDEVVRAMTKATLPTIVDVGTHTATSLLSVLAELAPDLKASGVSIGVLVIVTADPVALAEAPALLRLVEPLADARFVVENRLHGEVDAKQLGKIANGAVVTMLAEQVMEDHAVAILQAGGFASVTKLDPAKLNDKHGLALGSRIRRDLTRFDGFFR